MIGEELGYDMGHEQVLFDSMWEKLNEEQVACFNSIVATVESHERNTQQQEPSGAFFLHGPAGTGKTFLYNCLCSHFQSQGKIVLCVASSGIAAQFLHGGWTAHSRFKISLSNDINAVCNITHNSSLGELIRTAFLIIWDEVPIQHTACFKAVNRTLNNVCNTGNQQFFGGIPTVLGGDFARILPVIRRGTRQSTVLACIQPSSIWPHWHILRHKKSMRIVTNEANQEFLTFLHSMVTNSDLNGRLELPAYIRRYPQLIISAIICIHRLY